MLHTHIRLPYEEVFSYIFSIETNIEHLKGVNGTRILLKEMKIQSKNLPGKNKSFASLIFLVCLPSLGCNEDWV